MDKYYKGQIKRAFITCVTSVLLGLIFWLTIATVVFLAVSLATGGW